MSRFSVICLFTGMLLFGNLMPINADQDESADDFESTEAPPFQNPPTSATSDQAPGAKCKALWDNSCVTGDECCSGYCWRGSPDWATGVCKNKIGLTCY